MRRLFSRMLISAWSGVAAFGLTVGESPNAGASVEWSASARAQSGMVRGARNLSVAKGAGCASRLGEPLSTLLRIPVYLNGAAIGTFRGPLFTGFQPIHSADGIWVVGVPGATWDVEHAEGIATILAGVDVRAAAWGLRRPASTRVILRNLPVLDDELFGGYGRWHPRDVMSMATPRFHWQGGIASELLLDGVGRRAYGDASLWIHGRARQLLEHTFSDESFVMREWVQAGLADYIAASSLDDPRIGVGMIENGRPVRDVSDPGSLDASQRFGGVHRLGEEEPQWAGLFVSSALWRVRTAVGSEAAESLMEPLLDNLDRYYESFEAGLESYERLGTQRSIAEARYVLATIERTLIEQGLAREGLPALDAFAREHVLSWQRGESAGWVKGEPHRDVVSDRSIYLLGTGIAIGGAVAVDWGLWELGAAAVDWIGGPERDEEPGNEK